ncbi:MAG: class I SAM-dependent methyltransferase [Actinomycetota bacterium]
MDPKALNALVHDHEADAYDDRFLIDISPGLGKAVLRELTEALGGVPRATRLLDVACGTGYLALGAGMAGIAQELVATDISAGMLKKARENAGKADIRLELACADGEALPFRDASFDLVVVRGALHHVPDPVAMLRECRRLLTPVGRVACIAEPTASGERQVGRVVGSLYKTVTAIQKARGKEPTPADAAAQNWELASMAANLHTFSREDLERAGAQAGFSSVKVGSASWAWVLTLGVHYYLAGAFPAAWRHGPMRRVSARVVRAADALDRAVLDAVIPDRFHHTLWAVMS